MSTPSSEIGSRPARPGRHPRLRRRGCRPGPPGGPVRLQPGLARRGVAVGDRWSADRGGRARRGRQHRPRRRRAAQRLRPGPAALRALAPREGAHRARRPHLVPHLGCRRAAGPQRPHRHPVPPGRGRRPHRRRRPARPARRSPATSSSSPRPAPPSPTTGAATPASGCPQLVEAVVSRHQRQGDLAQSIEPELKEAHGGLRDMTVLSAMAEAWLADRPHGGVDAAHGLLLDVRDAVHVVTGRGRDRLGREEHDAVAALLGHDDADDLLTAVSSAGRHIAYAARRHAAPRRPVAARPHPAGRPAPPADDPARPRPVRQRRRGRARLDPPRRDRRGDADARRRRRGPRRPADRPDHARQPRQARADPVRPLARRRCATCSATCSPPAPAWSPCGRAWTRSGIVDTWLPEWSAVRSRPQRNAVHRHTVDRHLVETVVLAAGLVRRVSRPDLLLVAALLHDIGKVRGAHDHSVTGAELTRGVVTRWGFAPRDVEVLVTLVREHLTLIELATRRDHQDPATVDAAIAAVGGDRRGLRDAAGPHRGRRVGRRAGGLDRLAGHPARPARGRGARPARRPVLRRRRRRRRPHRAPTPPGVLDAGGARRRARR